jgi:hypothetical protein
LPRGGGNNGLFSGDLQGRAREGYIPGDPIPGQNMSFGVSGAMKLDGLFCRESTRRLISPGETSDGADADGW